MKEKKVCEVCSKNKVDIDLTLPLPIGILRADLCMDCGFVIHEDINMLKNLIEKRAQKLSIKLPASLEDLKKVLAK